MLDRRGRPVRVVKHAADVSEGKLDSADAAGQLTAINRAQGVIHFALDGTILDGNPSFLTPVGYARDELIGQPHPLLVDPAYAGTAEYRDFWGRLRAGEYRADVHFPASAGPARSSGSKPPTTRFSMAAAAPSRW